MSALVQATCPGCKKTLRIPAEWLQQPLRCKYCGMVLNAKTPPPAAPAKSPPPAAPSKPRAAATPPRPKPPAEERKAAAAEPVRKPTPARERMPVARPTYPDTEPIDSPFADLEDERTGRRKRSYTGAILVAAMLLLLLLAGGGAVALIAIRSGVTVAGLTEEKRDDATPANANVGEASPADSHAVPRPTEPSPAVPVPLAQPVPEAREQSVPFPRRALLISVHNYLFANPVGAGMPTRGARKVGGLPDKLSNGLRIPRNQIVHLSDAAANGTARPPLRPVIEKTFTSFLGSSRPQDRIVVFFIGHAVETGDDAFLMPLEGELDRPETLIPFKWVCDELARCPARQKVLVLDVCRLNPLVGTERPGGDAMGPKLAAAIKSPPPGVQIWSACGPEQHSYETEKDGMGVFLDELQTGLERASEGKLRLQDHIQKPEDPIPLERLKEAVDALVEKEVRPLKLAQISLLTGSPAAAGVAYDPAEPPAPLPVLAPAPRSLPAAKQALLTKLLADVAVPPIKRSMQDSGVNFAFLPPFDEKRLEPYLMEPGEETELQKAVRSTQALLYAASGSPPPGGLAKTVESVKKTLKGDLTTLRDGYRAPTNENQFKNRVMEDEKNVARVMKRLTEAHEELKGIADKRDAEPKRWQASYDFMLARLEGEIAYLYEYQSMLGQMRKELPPRDRELYGGWKLAATTTLTGDSAGKKMGSSSRKLLDKIIKDYAGTPWEILAKREKLTALGLEWKPAQ